jgi:hypothetical protein
MYIVVIACGVVEKKNGKESFLASELITSPRVEAL